MATPDTRGCLIEVHPTIIFKKLANPNVADCKKWVNLKDPPNKNGGKRCEGRVRRRSILMNKGIKIQEKLHNTLKRETDYIDALMAAYTAEQYAHRNIEVSEGKRDEGFLWFPKS